MLLAVLTWCKSFCTSSMRAFLEGLLAGSRGPSSDMYFCTPANIFTALLTFSPPSLSSEVGIISCHSTAVSAAYIGVKVGCSG